MGNLTSTPYSEITATLELFEECGVDQEDLKFLRRHRGIGASVAEAMLSHRRNFKKAVSGDEEQALASIALISDDEVLVTIAGTAHAHRVVRLKAVAHMSKQERLYDVARNTDDFEVAVAAMHRLDITSNVHLLAEYGMHFWREGAGRAALRAHLEKLEGRILIGRR